MPTRDPNTRQAAQHLAMSRARARAVVRSRRTDRRAVLVLAGLGAAAALALVLAPSMSEAKFGGWTCYHLQEQPQGVVQNQGFVPPEGTLPQGTLPQGAFPQGVQAVMPSAVAPQGGYPPSLDALPQGHQVGQAYSHAVVAPSQPVPGYSHSGTSGLGVVINGVWYPEPDVSRYFYYVEIPGEGPTYCQPTAAVQGQADGGQTYGSHRTSGVVRGSVPVVQQDPLVQQAPGDLGTVPSVPFGYAGAPGTIFQPVAGNP